MTDFERLHKMAREDIAACIRVWKEILEQLDIEYAYAKGSAIKKWESPIDYVPEISDVDIHVYSKNETRFLLPPDEFTHAMKISDDYERRFHEVRQEFLHFPQPQIMEINQLKNNVEYVPPRIDDIMILFGEVEQEELPDIDSFRQINLANLQGLNDFLTSLPMRVVDRAGFAFWSIIRVMAWRVSPSPVRVLSQTHDEPSELWSWSRTRIEQELRNKDYEQIADFYRGFYESGWDLFLSEFKSREAFRSTVMHGHNLLKGCYEEGLKFIQS